MNTTAKNTKVNADIREALTKAISLLPASGNDELASRVNKALTKKSTKTTELDSLLDEVIKAVLDEAIKAVPNAEDKKEDKKPVEKKAKKPTADKKPVEKAIKKKPTEKADEKKPINKKADKKPVEKPKADKKPVEKTKPEVKSVPQTKASLPCATMFPEEIQIDGVGTLIRVNDEIKNMEDLASKIENADDGYDYFIATYWTARQIKEFNYAVVNAVKPVSSFPMDLDILSPVYYAPGIKRVFAVSEYTEAMFQFENDSISYMEDVNPFTKEKFRVRVSKGMEFEIYKVAVESEGEAE